MNGLRLERVTLMPPAGAAELLLELGAGLNGFGGSKFGVGEGTLEEFLQSCMEGEDAAKLSYPFVPQTVFWMIDDAGNAVGIIRVRHRLNDRLMQSGGNMGYFVREAEREKGYAKQAVRAALKYLGSMGVERALITMSPGNEASERVAMAVGGVRDVDGVHPDEGTVMLRYWVETA